MDFCCQSIIQQNLQEPITLPLIQAQTEKQISSRKKAARRAKQLIGKNIGRWTTQQRREYYVFLRIYSQFFVSKENRRDDKVYRMMANLVKTRSPDQCRTHHQKLELKMKKISKIMDKMRNQFGSIGHEEIVQKCSEQWCQNSGNSDYKSSQCMLAQTSGSVEHFSNGQNKNKDIVEIYNFQQPECHLRLLSFFQRESQILMYLQ